MATKRKPAPDPFLEESSTRRVIHVRAGGGFVSELQSLVRKVGTAIIGGDFGGNRRGHQALDIQVQRNTSSQVASGLRSIAFGYGSTASGPNAVAIGAQNRATADAALAVGYNNDAQAASSVAVGLGSKTYQQYAAAFGMQAEATFSRTHAISGAPIVQQDNGDRIATNDDWLLYFSAPEAVILTHSISLKTTGDYTVTLPTITDKDYGVVLLSYGSRFFVRECGLICTYADTVTVQPTVRFGVVGTLAKHVTAQQTTLLTATYRRQRYASESPHTGETSLSCGVTVAATATTLKGRFYWRGVLLEEDVDTTLY